ncbi:MAG: hypothetical protein ACXV7G_11980 [Halobacteriota archaeon]
MTKERWARPDSNRRPPPCEGSSGLGRSADASRPRNQLDQSPPLGHQALPELELPFTLDELADYAERRKYGLTHYSVDWINRSQKALWKTTKGVISKRTIDRLRTFVLNKYRSEWSHVKVLGFAKAFLKFLTKTRLDTRYHAFEVFLERPHSIKPRRITNRIIVKEDIENVLTHIQNAKNDGSISNERAQQYTAFTLFASYTGQRSVSTIARLRVGQFRDALQMEKPSVLVEADQDKVRYAHWVPLIHPLVEALVPLVDGRDDDELMFDYHSCAMWIKRQNIPLERVKNHFVLGDMRKWCIQYGCDTLGWELSNRSHILSHGLSSIEDKHYRHPLPE